MAGGVEDSDGFSSDGVEVDCAVEDSGESRAPSSGGGGSVSVRILLIWVNYGTHGMSG